MQRFNDIFLPPAVSSTINEYGVFIPIANAITLMQNDKSYLAYAGKGSKLLTIRITDNKVFVSSQGNITVYNPNILVLYMSRNISLSELLRYCIDKCELCTQLPIYIAEEQRRVARLHAYRLMIQWTHNAITLLARKTNVPDPITYAALMMKQPEAFESAVASSYPLSDGHLVHMISWFIRHDGSETKYVSVYALVREMFKLMRARMIVLLRQLMQPDIARMIVGMLYAW